MSSFSSKYICCCSAFVMPSDMYVYNYIHICVCVYVCIGRERVRDILKSITN